jgi:T5orf172 domain
MHYLYVAWAVKEKFVKIGISNDWRRRLRDLHSAANPLEFMIFKLFGFHTTEDARKVENNVINKLQNSSSYKNKKELFLCSPSFACDCVRNAIIETNVESIKNFPQTLQNLFEIGLSRLPNWASSVLSDENKLCYVNGAQDAIRALANLRKLSIKGDDLWALLHLDGFAEHPHLIHQFIYSGIADSNDILNSEEILNIGKSLTQEYQQTYDDWQNEE